MKGLFTIPALAMATLAITACDEIGGGRGGDPGGNSWTEDRIVEITERPTDGSPAIITRMEWNQRGAQIRETQTVSGNLVYEDSFEPNTIDIIRNRTIYNADGTTYKQRRVSTTVEINGYLWEKTFVAYNVDENGGMIRPAVEQYEYEYDDTGNPTSYKHWENDLLTKYQHGFTYNYDQAEFWQQNSEDKTDIQKMYHISHKVNDRFDGSYSLYIGDPRLEGIKIEEKKIVDQSDFNQSYTLTRWDPETGEKIYESSFAIRTQEFTFTW